MALSLNELNKKSSAKRTQPKKSKVAKKVSSEASIKIAKSTSRKAKIKPWQKIQSKTGGPTREVLEQVMLEIQKQAKTLKKDFKKADYWVKIALETQKWIKDIQVYPKIRIPVPPFLSHIDRD